jgi:hypothetical protein
MAALMHHLTTTHAPQSAEELAAVRELVRRGSPFGNDAWQKQIALEMGLTSTLRGRGRPSRVCDHDRRIVHSTLSISAGIGGTCNFPIHPIGPIKRTHPLSNATAKQRRHVEF